MVIMDEQVSVSKKDLLALLEGLLDASNSGGYLRESEYRLIYNMFENANLLDDPDVKEILIRVEETDDEVYLCDDLDAHEPGSERMPGFCVFFHDWHSLCNKEYKNLVHLGLAWFLLRASEVAICHVCAYKFLCVGFRGWHGPCNKRVCDSGSGIIYAGA